MNNSSLFKQAHNMAKSMHKPGENYQVTFGACLKLIKAQQAKAELVAIEQEVSTKESESSFWLYFSACILLVLLMPVFNLNAYSILVGCSVCILGYVFEPFILAKLDSFKRLNKKPLQRIEPVYGVNECIVGRKQGKKRLTTLLINGKLIEQRQ